MRGFFRIKKYIRLHLCGRGAYPRPIIPTTMTERKLQIKTAAAMPLEVKSIEGSTALHIKGYAAAFGNVDSWGDEIVPGAFADFLASENAGRCKLCYQHDGATVIGKITSMSEDAVGLLFEADIVDTTVGNDVAKLLTAGAVDEFSIGYYADEFHFEKREGYDYDIRVLTKCTVVEISPVSRAANPKAVLLDAKDAEGTARTLATMPDADLLALGEAVKGEITLRAFRSLTKDKNN